MKKRILTLTGLLVVASMLLSACASAAASPEQIIQTVVVEGEVKEIIVTATPDPSLADGVEGEKKIIRGSVGNGDIPTTDPSLTSDSASLQIVEEIYIGLTRMDESTLELGPGMATEWSFSEDQKTITFKLRNDVPWVKYDYDTEAVVKVQDCDGKDRMVTAKDFEYGILRTLNPATGSDYAYVLNFAIAGAEGYNQGKTDDPATVGVRAIDDATLELTFNAAAPYNLSIAGMWVAYAEPKWLIEGDDCTEARTDRWTETGFSQSYGPFAMKEWVHDSYLTMIKNPFWPGDAITPQPKVDEVVINMLDDPAWFAEYEAGNMEYARVPQADMDRVRNDPVYSEELSIFPVLSTYFYGFNTTAEYVDDVRVRRALSMAIDREALIANVVKGDQSPARWFCPPGLPACPTPEKYPDLGIGFDVEKAKASLQEYLDEKGLKPEDVKITLMFNTNEGHRRIAEAVQAMWQENLGLTVELTNQEWRVFLKTVKSLETPQIYRSGWNLDYVDTNNFTRDVASSGGNDNPVDDSGKPAGGMMWKNDRFEELVKAASAEMDPDKRMELYAEAEQILVADDAALIPIYWYTSVQVTKPYVTRTQALQGRQSYEKWDILPH